ncbi:MAG: carboxypeptidase-like regulatory domain-containing protein [Zavarzinella sp.]
MIPRILICFVIVSLIGCGDKPSVSKEDGVEVSGKVFLANGQPLKGGTLILRPVGGVHGASGNIDASGNFTLSNQTGENKVVPGKYLAYVQFKTTEHKPLAKLLHVKYQSSEDGDSDVEVTIDSAKTDLVIKFK